MTEKQKIRIETKGPVTTIIINRPEVRNALDQESSDLLAQAFRAFEADDSQRVAVVTGAGGAFCAGADLKETATRVDYKAWAGHPEGPFHAPLSKPLIAAVEGHAVAGGMGLALYCDIRIADASAVFGIFCRRWGVPMSDGTTVRLPRVIGLGPALDMMLTGRPVSAQEALSMGLVTRVVPDGTARAAAEELAQQIADFPQIAMLSDRESVYAQQGKTDAEAIHFEMLAAEEAKQKEAQAGAARFADGEGRHGTFK
ncbi:crotonase/enoyl-CoA hydratase family protein [Sneathiella chungangensis]|uniref:Crotonase/enoyl-CoA hydratase family protein n=1 Tax=Sneathiella chungangensis TaxID=1418234 RepID=A0A845MBD0_9PROT|nr:crotonase/enoyl-CoA hydratase family protein [Sneathiella chungangensis]MZR21061.1 crotonase/enoyl-CoA hydratase family protein [Sneathiella chungangensis]